MKISKQQLTKIIGSLLHEQHMYGSAAQKPDVSRRLKRLAWTDEQEDGIAQACKLARAAGHPITSGTRMPEWPKPSDVILDVEYQGSEVYVDLEGSIEVHGQPVKSASEFKAAFERT
jgi:hypothetical protein